MLDVEKFIDGIHDYLGRAISPLACRIKALEDRPMHERGEKGVDGKDGANGMNGMDGKDADPEQIKSVVAQNFEDMVSGLTRRFAEAAHG